MPLAAPLDARRGLFAGLIDHAPTFPPEELPLDEALRAHEAAVHSEPGWMVNRFVVRASHVGELPADFHHRLSVVQDAEFDYDPRIEAVEIPPRTGPLTGAPSRAIDDAPVSPAMWPEPPAQVFFEHPLGAGFANFVRWLADAATNPDARSVACAKVRCGPEAPTIDDLAGAVRSLRENGIPFKATAGLHHAVRTGGQHGFLNLLAAATFGDEEEALAETDPTAFAVDADAFRWRERTASPQEVAEMRRDLFVSFGSCSFTEPVEELRSLGLL